jgi:hypothetical protein
MAREATSQTAAYSLRIISWSLFAKSAFFSSPRGFLLRQRPSCLLGRPLVARFEGNSLRLIAWHLRPKFQGKTAHPKIFAPRDVDGSVINPYLFKRSGFRQLR